MYYSFNLRLELYNRKSYLIHKVDMTKKSLKEIKSEVAKQTLATHGALLAYFKNFDGKEYTFHTGIPYREFEGLDEKGFADFILKSQEEAFSLIEERELKIIENLKTRNLIH